MAIGTTAPKTIDEYIAGFHAGRDPTAWRSRA
jgi:hypothetical protein